MRCRPLLALGLGLGMALEHEARACTPPTIYEGYVTDITFETTVVPDGSSPVVCEVRHSFCAWASGPRFERGRLVVSATAVVRSDAPDGGENTSVAAGYEGPMFYLKDGAGGPMAQRRAQGPTAQFEPDLVKNATHVCLKTSGSDVCRPLPALRLEITPDEEARFAAGVREECDRFGPTRRDAGSDASTEPASDGGCNASRGNVGSPLAPLAALFWLVRRHGVRAPRRRRRRD